MAEPTPARRPAGRNPRATLLLLGAAGVAVGYFLYSRNKAAKASASQTAPVLSPQPVAAGSYGNGNDLSALLPYLQSQGNAGGVASSAPYTPPAGEVLDQQGYYIPGSTAPISDASGNSYDWIQTPQQAQSLIASGAPLYYQPLPGIFQPYQNNGSIAAPVFVKINSQGSGVASS
jgi:hypothetical protein